MSRATTVTPLGLVSEPNQYGQYPIGALRQAFNVCMRKPGLLEPLPALTNYRAAVADADETFRTLWAGASYLFGVASDGATEVLYRMNASGSATVPLPEFGSNHVGIGKAHMAAHRGRYLFTFSEGVIALETESAAAGYLAGFPAPRRIDFEAFVTTGAQAIGDDKEYAYRALFVRQGTDGSYVKIGPPSYPLWLHNTEGGTRDVQIRVSFSAAIAVNLRVGDKIELYRTATQPLNTDPGGDFFLVATYTIVSADLGTKSVVLTDSTPDAGLGAALYTNDGEEGSGAAKYPPPLADDACVYKGRIFYVVPKLAGYLDVRVPGTWSVTLISTADRTHGIGIRPVDIDTVLLSTTISNISNTTGLVAGQLVDDLAGNTVFPANTTIVSVNHGASTAVVSAAALGTHSVISVGITDRIKIGSVGYTAAHPLNLVAALGLFTSVNLTFSQALRRFGADPVNATGLQMRIEAPWYICGVPTVTATNGQNYDPPLPEYAATAKSGTQDERYNRLLYSELDQPEAVPQGNELLVGSGIIHRIIATTDALYVWCSDGLYRVSGEFPDWRVDPIDPTLVLGARNSLDISQQTIWAQTNRGLVALSEGDGLREISTGAFAAAATYADTWDRWLTADETTHEVWIHETAAVVGTTALIYNTLTKAFTQNVFSTMGASESVSASAYAPFLAATVWANVDGGTPDLRKAHATTKCEGVIVTHQPITGDDDPFTTKNWLDCTWLMRVPTSALSLLPTMNGVEFDPTIVVSVPAAANATLDSRGIAGIALEAALGASIEVGWRPTANVTQAWQYRGLSLRFRLAADQAPVR